MCVPFIKEISLLNANIELFVYFLFWMMNSKLSTFETQIVCFSNAVCRCKCSWWVLGLKILPYMTKDLVAELKKKSQYKIWILLIFLIIHPSSFFFSETSYIWNFASSKILYFFRKSKTIWIYDDVSRRRNS